MNLTISPPISVDKELVKFYYLVIILSEESARKVHRILYKELDSYFKNIFDPVKKNKNKIESIP